MCSTVKEGPCINDVFIVCIGSGMGHLMSLKYNSAATMVLLVYQSIVVEHDDEQEIAVYPGALLCI